jgi:hypothetical protein
MLELGVAIADEDNGASARAQVARSTIEKTRETATARNMEFVNDVRVIECLR